MLFAGILLFSVGYTLVYCGVKGDHYRIIVGDKKIPGWQQPWLPFVALFSRSPRIRFEEDTRAAQPASYNTAAFYGQNPDAGTSGNLPPPDAGTSGNLPPPGPGQSYG
jgi:hypothetical protein